MAYRLHARKCYPLGVVKFSHLQDDRLNVCITGLEMSKTFVKMSSAGGDLPARCERSLLQSPMSLSWKKFLQFVCSPLFEMQKYAPVVSDSKEQQASMKSHV